MTVILYIYIQLIRYFYINTSQLVGSHRVLSSFFAQFSDKSLIGAVILLMLLVTILLITVDPLFKTYDLT